MARTRPVKPSFGPAVVLDAHGKPKIVTVERSARLPVRPRRGGAK
jgi:hypothetical protein